MKPEKALCFEHGTVVLPDRTIEDGADLVFRLPQALHEVSGAEKTDKDSLAPISELRPL